MHWIILAANTTNQSGGTSVFTTYIVPTISGIIFFILGVFTTIYVNRPKLAITGGGGIGGPGGRPDEFQIRTLTVMNVPGHIGITIGQNVLFGLRLNKKHRFGIPARREPATGCYANLYDHKGSHISTLWWRDPDNSDQRQLTVDIGPEKLADLFVFAQRNDDAPNYYAYVRDSEGNTVVPSVKFSGSKRFIIRVFHSGGHGSRSFKYTVYNNYRDGSIGIREGWHKRV